MKHIIVLISFLLFIGFKGLAQEIVIPKDTLYLDYSYYFKNCRHSDIMDKLKWKKENGIQFNLCGEAILFYPKNGESDTLAIKGLNDYHFTKVEDLDKLEKEWHKRTKPLLIKKYGIPYPNTTNKNNMFVTYLIEECGNYFIKYRVYWRHQKP